MNAGPIFFSVLSQLLSGTSHISLEFVHVFRNQAQHIAFKCVRAVIAHIWGPKSMHRIGIGLVVCYSALCYPRARLRKGDRFPQYLCVALAGVLRTGCPWVTLQPGGLHEATRQLFIRGSADVNG